MIVFLMCLALVYTGGKDNTALYWLMFYPVAVFAILGVKFGAWLSSAMLLCCIVMLYGPDMGQVIYGEVEKVWNSSVTFKLEARRHSPYNGSQKVVCSTEMTFVRIDGDGDPVPIHDNIKAKYSSN